MTNRREGLLTVDEAAEVLNVSEACIRRWILEAKITTVKLGRLVRVPSSEIDRLVEDGLRPAKRRVQSGYGVQKGH